jgi:hypothetical protein
MRRADGDTGAQQAGNRPVSSGNGSGNVSVELHHLQRHTL